MFLSKRPNFSVKVMTSMMMESTSMMILEAKNKMEMAILGILLTKLFITPIIWLIWALLSINLMLKKGGGHSRKMIN